MELPDGLPISQEGRFYLCLPPAYIVLLPDGLDYVVGVVGALQISVTGGWVSHKT